MAYTDDWENLMNGVFGPGGKLRFDTQKTPPEKPGLPDMNAALLEQQKKLDEMLKKQNAELRRDTTQEALAQSRKMLEDMEADGLLAKGTTEVKQEHLGSFEGLAAEVKKTVLGQDAFVDGVVRAMRRPFVLGTEAPTARNVILLCGAPGTGRHFALTETARCMAARGLLQSDKLAVMDLALYPNSGAEKLFLQDLYAALHAPGEILVFEHREAEKDVEILSDQARNAKEIPEDVQEFLAQRADSKMGDEDRKDGVELQCDYDREVHDQKKQMHKKLSIRRRIAQLTAVFILLFLIVYFITCFI